MINTQAHIMRIISTYLYDRFFCNVYKHSEVHIIKNTYCLFLHDPLSLYIYIYTKISIHTQVYIYILSPTERDLFCSIRTL